MYNILCDLELGVSIAAVKKIPRTYSIFIGQLELNWVIYMLDTT